MSSSSEQESLQIVIHNHEGRILLQSFLMRVTRVICGSAAGSLVSEHQIALPSVFSRLS
jgi:hypothetical protein